MRRSQQHNRIIPHAGRGVFWMTVLLALVVLSCSQDQGGGNESNGTFFPLAKGNSWVFLKYGSGTDSTFDSIWINYDSVRTTATGREHWYILRGTSLLEKRIWVLRDSVGDLWFTERDFETPEPFLMPSKVHGEKWLFRRYCAEPDTLVVSDTGVTIYPPINELFKHVRKISAAAACPKGDWEILLARGTGPVRWSLKTTAWELIRARTHDDASNSVSSMSGHVLSPD